MAARSHELPPGRFVELPGRGRTFIREVEGPPGAPAVLLLHGWTATADMNFFPWYGPLGQRFRVVTLDHRGHGQGIRSNRPLRLATCADDAVALLDLLGITGAVVVGYSMGGAIAQLVWRRHRDRTIALVLAATCAGFRETRDDFMGFLGLSGLAALSRVLPGAVIDRAAEQFLARRQARGLGSWAIDQMRPHDWRAILEAGGAIGTFSSAGWLKEIDVPTSVIVTTEDRVVPVERQMKMASGIPGAQVFTVDGGHDACADAELFVPTLMAALDTVAPGRSTRAKPA